MILIGDIINQVMTLISGDHNNMLGTHTIIIIPNTSTNHPVNSIEHLKGGGNPIGVHHNNQIINLEHLREGAHIIGAQHTIGTHHKEIFIPKDILSLIEVPTMVRNSIIHLNPREWGMTEPL